MTDDRGSFKNNFIDALYLISIIKTFLKLNITLITEKSLNSYITIFTKNFLNFLNVEIVKTFLKRKIYTFIINTLTLIFKKILSKKNSKLSEMTFQKYFNVIYNHYSKNGRI